MFSFYKLSDFSHVGDIGEISELKFNDVANAPGSFSFSIEFSAKNWQLVKPKNFFYYSKRIAGIIETRSYNSSTGIISVSGVTFTTYLDWKAVYPGYSGTSSYFPRAIITYNSNKKYADLELNWDLNRRYLDQKIKIGSTYGDYYTPSISPEYAIADYPVLPYTYELPDEFSTISVSKAQVSSSYLVYINTLLVQYMSDPAKYVIYAFPDLVNRCVGIAVEEVSVHEIDENSSDINYMVYTDSTKDCYNDIIKVSKNAYFGNTGIPISYAPMGIKSTPVTANTYDRKEKLIRESQQALDVYVYDLASEAQPFWQAEEATLDVGIEEQPQEGIYNIDLIISSLADYNVGDKILFHDKLSGSVLERYVKEVEYHIIGETINRIYTISEKGGLNYVKQIY